MLRAAIGAVGGPDVVAPLNRLPIMVASAMRALSSEGAAPVAGDGAVRGQRRQGRITGRMMPLS